MSPNIIYEFNLIRRALYDDIDNLFLNFNNKVDTKNVISIEGDGGVGKSKLRKYVVENVITDHKFAILDYKENTKLLNSKNLAIAELMDCIVSQICSEKIVSKEKIVTFSEYLYASELFRKMRGLKALEIKSFKSNTTDSLKDEIKSAAFRYLDTENEGSSSKVKVAIGGLRDLKKVFDKFKYKETRKELALNDDFYYKVNCLKKLFAKSFNEYTNKLDKPFVIIIDNSEDIYGHSFDEKDRTLLYNLFCELENTVWYFSGRKKLDTDWFKDKYSKYNDYVNIHYFKLVDYIRDETHDELRDFINANEDKLGIFNLSDNALDILYKKTNGLPIWVSAKCSALIDFKNENPDICDEQEYINILNQSNEQVVERLFGLSFTKISDEAKRKLIYGFIPQGTKTLYKRVLMHCGISYEDSGITEWYLDENEGIFTIHSTVLEVLKDVINSKLNGDKVNYELKEFADSVYQFMKENSINNYMNAGSNLVDNKTASNFSKSSNENTENKQINLLLKDSDINKSEINAKSHLLNTGDLDYSLMFGYYASTYLNEDETIKLIDELKDKLESDIEQSSNARIVLLKCLKNCRSINVYYKLIKALVVVNPTLKLEALANLCNYSCKNIKDINDFYKLLLKIDSLITGGLFSLINLRVEKNKAIVKEYVFSIIDDLYSYFEGTLIGDCSDETKLDVLINNLSRLDEKTFSKYIDILYCCLDYITAMVNYRIPCEDIVDIFTKKIDAILNRKESFNIKYYEKLEELKFETFTKAYCVSDAYKEVAIDYYNDKIEAYKNDSNIKSIELIKTKYEYSVLLKSFGYDELCVEQILSYVNSLLNKKLLLVNAFNENTYKLIRDSLRYSSSFIKYVVYLNTNIGYNRPWDLISKTIKLQNKMSNALLIDNLFYDNRYVELLIQNVFDNCIYRDNSIKNMDRLIKLFNKHANASKPYCKELSITLFGYRFYYFNNIILDPKYTDVNLKTKLDNDAKNEFKEFINVTYSILNAQVYKQFVNLANIYKYLTQIEIDYLGYRDIFEIDKVFSNCDYSYDYYWTSTINSFVKEDEQIYQLIPRSNPIFDFEVKEIDSMLNRLCEVDLERVSIFKMLYNYVFSKEDRLRDINEFYSKLLNICLNYDFDAIVSKTSQSTYSVIKNATRKIIYYDFLTSLYDVLYGLVYNSHAVENDPDRLVFNAIISRISWTKYNNYPKTEFLNKEMNFGINEFEFKQSVIDFSGTFSWATSSLKEFLNKAEFLAIDAICGVLNRLINNYNHYLDISNNSDLSFFLKRYRAVLIELWFRLNRVDSNFADRINSSIINNLYSFNDKFIIKYSKMLRVLGVMTKKFEQYINLLNNLYDATNKRGICGAYIKKQISKLYMQYASSDEDNKDRRYDLAAGYDSDSLLLFQKLASKGIDFEKIEIEKIISDLQSYVVKRTKILEIIETQQTAKDNKYKKYIIDNLKLIATDLD